MGSFYSKSAPTVLHSARRKKEKQRRYASTKGEKHFLLEMALILQLRLVPWSLIWYHTKMYLLPDVWWSGTSWCGPKIKGNGKSLSCKTDVGLDLRKVVSSLVSGEETNVLPLNWLDWEKMCLASSQQVSYCATYACTAYYLKTFFPAFTFLLGQWTQRLKKYCTIS